MPKNYELVFLLRLTYPPHLTIHYLPASAPLWSLIMSLNKVATE